MEIEPFDLVVVNLYPFVETVKSGAAQDDVVEQIDIGGPAMVRSAAKNHAAVAIVVDPASYGAVVAAAASGGFDLKTRRRLAAKAFAHTATYDTAVATWTASQFLDEDGDGVIDWPAYAGLALERSEVLRYGENPHQQAALYVDKAAPAGIAQADQLHGKAMSYNNFVDADAALRAAFDFAEPAVAIIKHANPCGVAVGSASAADPIADAHAKAHACDPGVRVRRRHRREPHRHRRHGPDRRRHLHRGRHRAGLRGRGRGDPVQEEEHPPPGPARGYGRYPTEFRQVSGGMLVQATDKVDADGDNPANWTLAAGDAADAATLADLAFAWTACRAAKSNAILLADNGAAVGIGMGQVNRLDSCKLAVERANTLGVTVESDVEGAAPAAAVRRPTPRARRSGPAAPWRPRTRSSRSPTDCRSWSTPACAPSSSPAALSGTRKSSPQPTPPASRCTSPERATSSTRFPLRFRAGLRSAPRDRRKSPHKEWTCPPLPGGHVHFLCQPVAGAVPGTCSFSRGHVHFAGHVRALCGQSGDMSILCPRRDMLILRGEDGHMGDMSRPRMWGGHVRRPGFRAGRGTCPFSQERAGRGDMLIRAQAPRSHPGGHVHSSWPRPGHMGYMSGPWC